MYLPGEQNIACITYHAYSKQKAKKVLWQHTKCQMNLSELYQSPLLRAQWQRTRIEEELAEDEEFIKLLLFKEWNLGGQDCQLK